ncbi:MAG: CBS domain-containing protein, partial [Bacillota bacterium]
KKIFIDTNFSRIPIYGQTKSDIKGILYRTDFYEMLLSGQNNIKELLKQPIYIQTTSIISNVFKKLQENMVHMAIVKDKEKIVGLLTMDDILEELVGEIEDRYDK